MSEAGGEAVRTGATDRPWWMPGPGIGAVLVAWLAGLVLVTAVPSVTGLLVLRSPLLDPPANALRLFTYWLVNPGILSLAALALFTVASAGVLRGRLEERWMLAALAAGAGLGGVAFGLRTEGLALAGGFIAAWGLAGAVVGGFIRARDRFGGWRTAYALLAGGIVLAGALGGAAQNAAIVAAALAGGIIGAARVARHP